MLLARRLYQRSVEPQKCLPWNQLPPPPPDTLTSLTSILRECNPSPVLWGVWRRSFRCCTGTFFFICFFFNNNIYLHRQYITILANYYKTTWHTYKKKNKNNKQKKRHYYEVLPKLSSILVHVWLPIETFIVSLF